MTYKLTGVASGQEFCNEFESLKDALGDAIERRRAFPKAVIFLKDLNSGASLDPIAGTPLGTCKKGRVIDSRMTPAFQQLLDEGYTPRI